MMLMMNNFDKELEAFFVAKEDEDKHLVLFIDFEKTKFETTTPQLDFTPKYKTTKVLKVSEYKRGTRNNKENGLF